MKNEASYIFIKLIILFVIMNRKYIVCSVIVAVLLFFLIVGCVNRVNLLNTSKNFQDYLNSVNTKSEYQISEFGSFASSGGGTQFNTTRNLTSDEIKRTIKELRNVQPIGSFEAEGRICYYSAGADPIYFVCFANDKITNYIQKNGPSYTQWNVLGYEFNFKRSTIINSTSNLKTCNSDADCTLTSNGVCDPTGKCGKISAACDPGCRTSINSNQEMIWEFVPLIEDECITDKCANDEKKEYFTASCKNNICESVIVS